MNKINPNKFKIYFVFFSLLIFSLSCLTSIPATPTPTPIPIIPPNNIGDYGDAPDGSLGMDTGYYEMAGGPFYFTLQSAGIQAAFPTLGDASVPGPYMLDVDEFYIGPLYGGDFDGNVPSVEEDATDPFDPDGLANLTPDGKADCDAENGSHNPAGNGCSPVPAYSMPMNGRLTILFGYPPLGIFSTSISVSETLDVDGPAYWNLLFDLNQDGEWGAGEWVAQNKPVSLEPGENIFMVSDAFKFPTSGTPFGRLKFPIWARSMVTLDKVGPNNWDGRGIPGGFSHGEVEDYFIEWRPIGQILPEYTGEQFSTGEQVSACEPESITTISCPESAILGETVTCEIHGPVPETLDIACVPNSFLDGSFGSASGDTASANGEDCGVSNVEIGTELVTLSLTGTTSMGEVSVLLTDGTSNTYDCRGAWPTGVSSGAAIQIAPPAIAEVDLSGVYYLWPIIVVFDPDGHLVYVGFPQNLYVNLFFGSITIEGPAPWVNVTGDFNEDDGSFFASGYGTVAGYPNISVTFEGVVTEDGLLGNYTMGAEGGLPGGQPIIFQIEGTQQKDQAEETAAPVSDGVLAAIDTFAQAFNDSFLTQNSDLLYSLIHPAVIDLYGEAACKAYLGVVIESQSEIEVLDVTKLGLWTWEIDDRSTLLDHIYKVDINFTANSNKVKTDFRLSMPGDDSVRWFTDCGDPLP